MRIALLVLGLLLAPATIADNWWIQSYGFDQTQLDGAGVTIAVIDTGIDSSHPDLLGTVIDGVDFSTVGVPNGTSGVGSSSFHGTMVASLIAGQGSTGSGVIGVAPKAKLLAISIGLGVPGSNTDDQIGQAVRWAVDHDADIINLSLTRNSQTWPRSWDDAFSYAFENDVLVVAAAGNRTDQSSRPSAPATIPGVVSVGGVTKNQEPAEASTAGLGVAISAPAEDLLGAYPGEGYRLWDGSSAAAPLVSGLLALMKQADPKASANDLIKRLLTSATDLGLPGYDANYGHGVINPVAALASKATAEENPLGSLENWITQYRSAVDEEQSELVVPSEPEPIAVDESTASEEIPEPVGQSISEPWLNPILYWLLAPLAPLLWIVLRRKRTGNSGALKKTKGKPQHDSSDN
ncbi:MAG: S8 family serine peptidase [Aquiluna sp.]|nr:S8 family serine peptidase [Aquiluna sp.]